MPSAESPFGPVCAVVVTHNRRELLERCLRGIESQDRPPDRILVIDNISTDGSREFLDSREWVLPHQVVHTDRNLGGAGGFALGIDLAAQDGMSPWVMDDDAEPLPGALAVLIADTEAVVATGRVPAFACSIVEWSDGSVNHANVARPSARWLQAAVDTDRWIVEVDAASFVSVLVPESHVRQVGLPHADYFKWFDDIEYTDRLSDRFGPGICSMRSRVRHHSATASSGIEPWRATPGTSESHRIGLRNRTSAALTHRNARGLYQVARDSMRVLAASDLPLRQRLRVIGGVPAGVMFRPAPVPVGTNTPPRTVEPGIPVRQGKPVSEPSEAP